MQTIFQRLLSQFTWPESGSAAEFVAFADAELAKSPPVGHRGEAGHVFVFRDPATGAISQAKLYVRDEAEERQPTAIAITDGGGSSSGPRPGDPHSIMVTGGDF